MGLLRIELPPDQTLIGRIISLTHLGLARSPVLLLVEAVVQSSVLLWTDSQIGILYNTHYA